MKKKKSLEGWITPNWLLTWHTAGDILLDTIYIRKGKFPLIKVRITIEEIK